MSQCYFNNVLKGSSRVFYVYFRGSIDKKFAFSFQFGTDDDHRVVLKSISGGVECEHDYINAAYVDVSFLKYLTRKNLHQALCKWLYLILRVTLKAKSTLPLKVSFIRLVIQHQLKLKLSHFPQAPSQRLSLTSGGWCGRNRSMWLPW